MELRTNRMTTDGRLTEKSMFSITETISVPLTEDFISSYVNCTNKQKKIIKIKTKNQQINNKKKRTKTKHTKTKFCSLWPFVALSLLFHWSRLNLLKSFMSFTEKCNRSNDLFIVSF